MVLTYWMLFFLLILLGLLLIEGIVMDLPLSVWVQLGVQSFFFAGLGYVAITVLGHVGGAVAVVLLYASTQVLTMGNLFSWINIYWYLYHPEHLLHGTDLLIASISVFLAGAGLLLAGQWALFRFRRF